MKRLALLGLVALMALALGCIGQKQPQKETGFITTSVKTTSVYGGTTVPIMVTIKNDYDIDLEDVNIRLTNVPAPHTASEPKTISKILKGTSRQIYLQINTQKVDLTEIIRSKVKVSFTGTSKFYFDMNIINASNPDLLTQSYPAAQGSSYAPISVSVQGLDRVEVSEPTEWTGAITVTNATNGTITSLGIHLVIPCGGIIESARLEFSNEKTSEVSCSNGKITLDLRGGDLSKEDFINPEALFQLTLKVKQPTDVTQIRVTGSVDFSYEIEENVPTITVKAVGR